MAKAKEKLSFWDTPPWIDKFDSLRLAIGLYIGWPLFILREACNGRWAESYALAVPYVAYGLTRIVGMIGSRCLSGRDSVSQRKMARSPGASCLTVMITFVVLESAGFAVFGINWRSQVCRYSFIATAIAAAWLAAMGLVAVINVLAPAKCRECGESRPQFELECSKGKSTLAGYYCREHFRESLHKGLAKHKGWFLVVERAIDFQLVKPSFSFYTLEDLYDGGYSEQDIESIKSLIDMALPSTAQDIFAVLIPMKSVTRCNQSEEAPLLKCSPEDSPRQPMTRAEFCQWFDQLLVRIDDTNSGLRMNLPYAETGVYILEGYG